MKNFIKLRSVGWIRTNILCTGNAQTRRGYEPPAVPVQLQHSPWDVTPYYLIKIHHILDDYLFL